MAFDADSKIGKDPNFPLVHLPTDTRYRMSPEQAEQRAQAEQEGESSPGDNQSDTDPRWLNGDNGGFGGDAHDRRGSSLPEGFEEDALEAEPTNEAYLSAAPAVDLAADALADHLHLQHALGFDQLDVLSADQKNQVADDLVGADQRMGELQQDLQSAVTHATDAQTLFVAAAHNVAALVAGKAADSFQGQITSAQAEKQKVNENIKAAGAIGEMIEGIIKVGISLVTLNPEELGRQLAETGEFADAAAYGHPGMLGKLAESFASNDYAGKLAELNAKIANLKTLKKGAVAAQNHEAFEAAVDALQAHFNELSQWVQDAANKAIALRDVMRTPPKRSPRAPGTKEPNAAAAAAAADEKDPVKQVELFVTSAMATNALLDGGIRATDAASAVLSPRLNTMFQQDHDLNLSMGPTKFGSAPDKSTHWRYRAPDEGALQAMINFISLWHLEAFEQKSKVAAEVDQVQEMKKG